MAQTIRAAAWAGALAGVTIFAVPAAAASPVSNPVIAAPAHVFDFSRYDPQAGTAEWRCRWRCGWGGWGRHRGWRRNRIDGGDVLIGAAIIGGAIAIANANDRRQRERDVVIIERDPRYRYRDRDWDRDRDDRRASPRGTGVSGLDNAVTLCLDRIERDVRVDTVDDVRRTASGWQVSGALFNGAPFACRIGNGGEIDSIDYGEGFARSGDSSGAGSNSPRGDGQWSDSRYADARMAVGGTVRPDLAVQEAAIPAAAAQPRTAVNNDPRLVTGTAMPAYPGGPIPGEVIPETREEVSGG